MSSITAVDDAQAYLVPPAGGGNGSYIWSLRMSAGLIVGGVDAAVAGLTGFSPLEEWIVKPFGGDWKALDKGAEAWHNAGKAAHAIEVNLTSVPGQVGDDWQGAAADAFKKKQLEVAEAIAPLPGACDALGEMCSALAELARAIGEFVVAVLKELVHLAIQIISSLASVVGSPVAAPLIVRLIAKCGEWGAKLANFITKFTALLGRIPSIVKTIATVLQVLAKLIKPLLKVPGAITNFNDGASTVGALAGGGYSGGGGGGGGGGGW